MTRSLFCLIVAIVLFTVALLVFLGWVTIRHADAGLAFLDGGLIFLAASFVPPIGRQP